MARVGTFARRAAIVAERRAMAFVRWLTAADRGQRLIERFEVEKYGAPMFFPDSRERRAAKPSR